MFSCYCHIALDTPTYIHYYYYYYSFLIHSSSYYYLLFCLFYFIFSFIFSFTIHSSRQLNVNFTCPFMTRENNLVSIRHKVLYPPEFSFINCKLTAETIQNCYTEFIISYIKPSALSVIYVTLIKNSYDVLRAIIMM